MIDRNEKITKELLEHLEKLIKENGDNRSQIIELLKAFENPIADESLNTFRRELQKNIAHRAKV